MIDILAHDIKPRAYHTLSYVNEAMNKVLAIDRAYPLPLLGVMLEKFLDKTEPTAWWPAKRKASAIGKNDNNGWSVELEEEMQKITRVLEVKDIDNYLRLGDKALKLNKALAIAGPLLTGLGAVGSAFVASSPHSSWAMVLRVMRGEMGSIVTSYNMVGKDMESRENGEVFEMKVALQLGRRLSKLRDVADASTRFGNNIEEFGSKLF
ncbi:probable F-box protein [Tanacetum coccineum]